MYARMAPISRPEPGFREVRIRALEGTRASRRTFRYFGLRVSALLFGVSGAVGVGLLGRAFGADVAWLGALPLPAYACFALGVPALFELIRPPSPSKKSKMWRWLGTLMFLVVLALIVAPSLKTSRLGWLVPTLLYLVPVVIARFWARAKAAKQNATAPVQGPSPAAHQRSHKGRPRPEAAHATSGASDATAALTRTWGLSEGVFWLLFVGVLPAFVVRLVVWPEVALTRGLQTLSFALLFVAVASVALGALGTLAERLWPKSPRLLAGLVVFGPFVASLFVPGFPNAVSLAMAASHFLLQQTTQGWGLI
jgi:hypothetical protein